MKKIFSTLVFLLALALAALVLSCGSRKVHTSKTENIRDSITINNVYSQTTKTVLLDIFKARPVDPLRPMWVDGKKYENAIISSDKSRKENKEITVTKTLIIYRTFDVTKTKTAQKKDNANVWVGVIFVLALFLFLYLKLKPPIK